MKGRGKRAAIVLALAGAVLAIAIAVTLVSRSDEEESWRLMTEGFLAVADVDGSGVAVWDTLDGPRSRPASTREVVQWLNSWPYRDRSHQDERIDPPLEVSLQSREVRCVGAPTGGEVPREGNDEQTLAALHSRKECTYARWKVWSGETAERLLNERHTVWVGEDGLFHGRVEYWK